MIFPLLPRRHVLISVSLYLALFASGLFCASAPAGGVVSVPSATLKKHSRVAITSIDIVVTGDQFETRNEDIRRLQNDMLKKNAADFGLPSSTGSKNGDFIEKFQDLIAENIHKSFIQKGFNPVERTKIKAVLNELSLQQSGLINSDSVAKIGELSRADAVFIGKLTISPNQGSFNDRLQLNFNGRLVSVDSGKVLAAGVVSSEKEQETPDESAGDSLKIADVRSLVNNWFRGLKAVTP